MTGIVCGGLRKNQSKNTNEFAFLECFVPNARSKYATKLVQRNPYPNTKSYCTVHYNYILNSC